MDSRLKVLFMAAGALLVAAGAAAQTPACGTVVTTPGTVITFDSDMTCATGFTGTALAIQAGNVTVNGAGFSIIATDASYAVSASYVTGINLQNLDLSGSGATAVILTGVSSSTFGGINASGSGGQGFYVISSNGNLFANNTVHGRNYGFRFEQACIDNVVRDNNLTDNAVGIGDALGGGRANNSFLDNDLSRSSSYGMSLSYQSNPTITGNNFTDCANGLQLVSVDSLTLSGLDFSGFNIPGTVLTLIRVTNSTFSGINASGTGGHGFYVISSDGNLFANNTVHGRNYGFRFEQACIDNVVRDNNLTDNAVGIGDALGGGRANNSFLDNDLSRSSSYGMSLSYQSNPTITGNNFTDCANGLQLVSVDSLTLSGLDFSGFNIPGTVLTLIRVTNSTFSGINASGTGGHGFYVISSNGNLFANNTVHGRNYGFRFEQACIDNVVRDNNLTDNAVGIGDALGGGRANNSFLDNDLSRSSSYGMSLSYQSNPTITGNNFTDCANGLQLVSVDSLTLSGLDFSGFNIPGTVLTLIRVTNSTFSGINASGTGGHGFYVISSDGNLFTGNTVHGRGYGFRFEQACTGNTVSDNDLTDNVYGIGDGLGAGRADNAFLDNDVSRSTGQGISLSYQTGSLIRGNLVVGCAQGIGLSRGENNAVSQNEVRQNSGRSITLFSELDPVVDRNLVIQGAGDGVVLLGTSGARFYHNNIYGNAGWQVSSDEPIELSYGNEGNYWGRHCTDEPFVGLFVAGEDSNSFDVVDSFAFGSEDAWLNGIDPGCGPPPPGSIGGTVFDDISGVASVAIQLDDSGHDLLGETDTTADGTYGFADLEPGIYSVSMIVPIGYAPVSPTEREAIVNSDEETTVDFELERLVLEVDTRGMGYWKHQAKAHLTGKGRTQETQADLLDYLDDIQEQYDVFDDVVGLEGLYSALEPPKPPTMREKSEQHLMALLLNLSSLRIATYTMVSEDDTAGEAVDFILLILDNPGSVKDELEYAKDLAEDINNGMIPLDPERIPEPEL